MENIERKDNQNHNWGQYEPFVDEEVVAAFLKITPRRVKQFARNKMIPAHPLGCVRKTWRFRISEVHATFTATAHGEQGTTSPRAIAATRQRKRLG